MTTDLVTIRPDEPVEMAKCLMEWKSIRHLPVEDDSGQLMGILSLTAIEQLDENPGRSRRLIPVREIMNVDPKVIGPERSVSQAAQEMASSQVDYLVVVDHGSIAGILTDLDIRRIAPDVPRSGF